MSMHYGTSGSRNTRLYTPNIGARRLGEHGAGVGVLPNLVWRPRAAGASVTGRPSSGLKLTIRHVDVPSRESHRCDTAVTEPLRPATQLRSRLSSRNDARQVMRKRQTSIASEPVPSSTPSAPAVTLPAIGNKTNVVDMEEDQQHPDVDAGDGNASSPLEENNNKSESESEVLTLQNNV